MWLKSHAFKNNDTNEKSHEEVKLSERWGGKKGAVSTAGESNYVEKQYRLSRRIIYNNVCEYKPKKPSKNHLTSKHLAENEVICPQQNN